MIEEQKNVCSTIRQTHNVSQHKWTCSICLVYKTIMCDVDIKP